MEAMTEAYGSDVPETIGRFDYDQERSENAGGPIEDAYYYDDGDGHGIAIEMVEWKEGYTVKQQRFGSAATDCIMSSKPLRECESRQQAFEAAQTEFGQSRVLQIVSAANQLLRG